MRPHIDRRSAELLRNMFSVLQRAILFNDPVTDEAVQVEMVKRISKQGFALVDDLEGVIC